MKTYSFFILKKYWKWEFWKLNLKFGNFEKIFEDDILKIKFGILEMVFKKIKFGNLKIFGNFGNGILKKLSLAFWKF